jgi:hypothetical protein
VGATASKPIIGNFGAVLDGDDGTLCTPQPIPVVRNRLLSPNNYLVPVYYFAIDGATIIHTRTTVNLECCVYSASDQTTAFDRDYEILFPEFLQQSTQYGQMFTAFLATLPPATMEAQAS